MWSLIAERRKLFQTWYSSNATLLSSNATLLVAQVPSYITQDIRHEALLT
jgi:hypothetical protein